MDHFPRLIDRLLEAWMPHLIAVPILVPMVAAAVMLLLGEQRRKLAAGLGVVSALLGLAVALAILRWVNSPDTGRGAGSIGVYLPGNWPAPFGIVLVADRLATAMVAMTAMVGVAATAFASSRWDRVGIHFHPLLQLQLMGLAGAFLTGDLFNLFVFFEVLLAASYGLLLHGSGRARVGAGLHYVALNLAGSLLFLLGAALFYGVTGTLNLADLSARIPQIPAADRGLLHAGAALLATAFLMKAGAWPLNFWLRPAYSAAVAPSAAVFAVLTKLGIYVLLRCWALMFSSEAGGSAHFGQPVLIGLGALSMVVATMLAMRTQRMALLAATGALLSAGTLLMAIGLARPATWAGAVVYLLPSTLAVAALFLLSDIVERWRLEQHAFDSARDAPFLSADLRHRAEINLDDDGEALFGRSLPAGVSTLGLSYIVGVLVLAGLPPLAGFIGKFAMLRGAFGPGNPGAADWLFLGLVLASGLATLTAATRIGIRTFWTPQRAAIAAVPALEVLPVLLLLAGCVAISIHADEVTQHAQAVASNIERPQTYRDAVGRARQIPGPTQQAEAEPPAPPTNASAR